MNKTLFNCSDINEFHDSKQKLFREKKFTYLVALALITLFPARISYTTF
jgi:hypothetical protein